MAVDMLQDQKDKKIVMYCTGGIRCEKASAWMKHNGFNDVSHIEGGIIEYTRRAREQGLPVRFKGKNFVFDERDGGAYFRRYSFQLPPVRRALRQPY
jgi:Predicted sulfurtransferase